MNEFLDGDMLVKVYMKIPKTMIRKLTKTKIRSKDVQLIGADWEFESSINRWRKVEDELPKLQCHVIVSNMKHIHVACRLSSITNKQKSHWHFLGNVAEFKVTHWMPLPEPPKD